MRVFNEEKTKELFYYNQDNGYLKADRMLVNRHAYKPKFDGNGHYDVKTFPNGGVERTWVWDEMPTDEEEAWDEYEDILVFVEYTAKELADREIAELKQKLAETDYQAIKFAEGVLSEADYASMRTQRQYWRDRINDLEQIS